MRLGEEPSKHPIYHVFNPDELSRITSLAVAVSGGSDSVALLNLAREGLAARGIDLVAMTVDHALRPESRAEAEQVAAWCKDLGIRHSLLTWHHPGTIHGNLANAAREARYKLMQDECLHLGIRDLLTGHTMDDQAETVLMRLARGSGVDGLAAIGASTVHGSITLRRPLLDKTREELRGYLIKIGQGWIDDPTNEDESYDRIKARKMFTALEPLGLTKQRLATTARIMGMARDALDEQAGDPHDVWQWSELGYAETDWITFQSLPREIKLRRLAAVLNCFSGGRYRPRLNALEDMLDRVGAGARTLHGCIVRLRHDKLTIMREPKAVSQRSLPAQSVNAWDRRFSIDLSAAPGSGLTIAMLGEDGLRQIPKENSEFSTAWSVAPREARLTTPALWQGDVLVSAPLAPWNANTGGPELSVKALWAK